MRVITLFELCMINAHIVRRGQSSLCRHKSHTALDKLKTLKLGHNSLRTVRLTGDMSRPASDTQRDGSASPRSPV